MALQPLGLGSEKPFGGSDYLIDKYADLGDYLGIDYQRPTNSTEELIGRFAGGVVSPAAIISALQKTPVNMSKAISAFKNSKNLEKRHLRQRPKVTTLRPMRLMLLPVFLRLKPPR